MKKALKYVGYGLIAFTIIGIIAVATDTSKAEEKSATAGTENTKPVDINYTVTKKEPSRDQLDYRLTINDRYDKASLIEVVRKLKVENNWKEKLVCFFDIKAFSQSNAWASVAYLPECPECETDKDADGNPVKFYLIGMTKGMADSLRPLTLDTIDHKQLIGYFIEDISKCKTELFYVNYDQSKILIGRSFADGGSSVEWVKLKTVDGEKRYYMQGEDPGKENYLVMDEETKMVDFRNYEGKTWMSYMFE
jgi:hypothetical protein